MAAVSTTQPAPISAPTAEPSRSKERHSRSSAEGVSGSMLMSDFASRSRSTMMRSSQPAECMLISPAAGAGAESAGGGIGGASAARAVAPSSASNRRTTNGIRRSARRSALPSRSLSRSRMPSASRMESMHFRLFSGAERGLFRSSRSAQLLFAPLEFAPTAH